ncbi:hypothetical protein JG688_00005462, partial [Phytophthora aleatoria]
VGPVWANDIFLDIGCGIGNIVAQFALQTPVRSCIGVEIRSDLWCLGCQLISRFPNVQLLHNPFQARIYSVSDRIIFYLGQSIDGRTQQFICWKLFRRQRPCRLVQNLGFCEQNPCGVSIISHILSIFIGQTDINHDCKASLY